MPRRRPAAWPPTGSSATGSKGATAALVELNCETDFVAKTDDFRKARQLLAEAVFAHAAFGDAPSLDVGGRQERSPLPPAFPGRRERSPTG